MSARLSPVVFLMFALTGLCRADQPDILFADFEGDDYGNWKTTGTAFGSAPAKGTLPGQMHVGGFKGKGLVNSFLGGDDALGTLTSPEFKVERKHISFLIGGGGYPGKTCVNLVVEGKVVRTVTGPNTKAGGSEELAPTAWDVTDLAGKMARIVIVDEAKGGWGHINADHFVFTDKKPAVPAPLVTKEKALTLEKRYLHLPTKTSQPEGKKQRVSLIVDGKTVRDFDMELSDKPEWFAHLDVTAWKGQKVTLRAVNLPEDSKALDAVTQADEIWGTDALYREPLRPQLHFSPRRGWTNDPNGMVFADGEYHLFFQHNPYGWHWGNMHWGHAVSKDLVRWEELPIALYPPKFDDMAFSGSAVVDKANTSGWKKGDNELLVAAFTSTGRGECIAYSNDRGRTWTEYEGNPVVKHAGRDPRLLWDSVSKTWIMAVYDEKDRKQWIVFHTSPDLKKWTEQSRIDGFFECPDIFELPVDGDATKRKWVLTAANSDYMIGSFDGKSFTPETAKLKGHRGRGFYAAQTFSHDPKGRVVQMGWFQLATPGMSFNQAMTIPLELKLVGTKDGPRLSWTPVKELEQLRAKTHSFGPMELKVGEDSLKGIKGELLEVRAEIEPGEAAEVKFVVRGLTVVYDTKKQEIVVSGQRAPAPLREGKQRLTIIADRVGFEIFADDGLTYVPFAFTPKADDQSVSLTVVGGSAKSVAVDVHELKSIWKK
ncbi:glycoside hydrolase family 32 protein [Zavarzinella formosa]|uniref:glycoside hydrolase family 32 protein n=1 Tax=Zavarzinella formosa TaxID=360055 RepID=UPI0003811AAE|nr:glycoside hydrolase family 32 protein [Zavarzinella formosa]